MSTARISVEPGSRISFRHENGSVYSGRVLKNYGKKLFVEVKDNRDAQLRRDFSATDEIGSTIDILGFQVLEIFND